MDSGNSGSIQSSSGEDENYDVSSSYVDHNNLLPNFFNPSISNSPNFFDRNSTQNNSLEPFSHLDSNPNLYRQDHRNYQTVQPSPSLAPQSLIDSQGKTRTFATSTSQGVKNPKKRTRASRRAPTTILQTNTANFRQMVQEFTGIPATPFSAATSCSRRMDLFGVDSLYGLRPSPPTIVQPFMNISDNMVHTCLPNTSALNNVGSTSNNYTNYHTMLLNQLLNFESLLQSQNESTTFAEKAKPSEQENLESNPTPSLDNLGFSNRHVNANVSGFASHESSNGTLGEHFGFFNLQKVQPSVDEGIQNVSSKGQGTVDSWNFNSE